MRRLLFLGVSAAVTLSACGYSGNNGGSGGGIRLGGLTAEWELRDANGYSVQCSPSESVHFLVDGADFAFACNAYGGTTGDIRAGTQHIVYEFDPVDGSAPVSASDTVTVRPDAVTDLGLITFHL